MTLGRRAVDRLRRHHLPVQARRESHAERDRANQEAATAGAGVGLPRRACSRCPIRAEARGETLTARELLANGARQIETELENQPAVRARLQATIGRVYTSIGMYVNARSLIESAYRLQTEVLGSDSVETVATADLLADLHWYGGQYDEAEVLYEDILARRRRLLGEDHPETSEQPSISEAFTTVSGESPRLRASRPPR